MKIITLVALCFFLAPACKSVESAKPAKPSLDLVETPPPPSPSSSRVVAIPPALTEQEIEVLEGLSVPLDGYVFSPEKAMAAARLRVYAEQAWTNAENNRKMCLLHTDVWWDRMIALDIENQEHRREARTWWSRNRNSVFFSGGVFVGAATTILVVFGVQEVKR